MHTIDLISTDPVDRVPEQLSTQATRVRQGMETAPRRFRLVREIDVTGVSGVGVVAYGVRFPDGAVATRWNAEIAQTCVWANVGDVVSIHGHNGATRLEWLD
jgi:hypothetical protein